MNLEMNTLNLPQIDPVPDLLPVSKLNIPNIYTTVEGTTRQGPFKKQFNFIILF